MLAPLHEIAAILRDLLRDDALELTPHFRFDEVSEWDSIHFVSAVVDVEDRFDVQFDLVEIDCLMTVGYLLRKVVLKQAFASA